MRVLSKWRHAATRKLPSSISPGPVPHARDGARGGAEAVYANLTRWGRGVARARVCPAPYCLSAVPAWAAIQARERSQCTSAFQPRHEARQNPAQVVERFVEACHRLHWVWNTLPGVTCAQRASDWEIAWND